jgi:hypothetical protein
MTSKPKPPFVMAKQPVRAIGAHLLPMCGRCYDEVRELHPPGCNERPEELAGMPLGMYHCPDCGSMVCAGLPHPALCLPCVQRRHPAFDAV